MKSSRKAFLTALAVSLIVVLGIGGALFLCMRAENPPKPEEYGGGTLDINFAEGAAHGAGDEVLIPVPAAAGGPVSEADSGTGQEDEEKGFARIFKSTGKAAEQSIVLEEAPADVWTDDKGSGYTSFTTRAQLPASDSIGVLEIPSIGLSVNAYDSEDDMADMDKGISHFQTTSYWDGNIAFAGHNGNLAFSFFGRLHNVKKGDVITYQTELGTRSYVVSSIRTIADNDWSCLERTADNRLTLITCVADPAKRLCVQAVEQ